MDSTVFDGTFIDFGSGKGRVVILAAKMGFKKVIGVEFSKELCDICNQNIRKLKLDNVEIINEDAVKLEIPINTSVFFFFCPFSEQVFLKVLDKVSLSILKTPRKAYVVSVNPKRDHVFSNDKFRLIRNISSPLGQDVNVYEIII
jgi:predicted RNA methylase